MNSAGKKLFGYYVTGDQWLPILVDSTGRLQVDFSNINLDDLADVDVASPTDNYIVYWDDAAGEWKARALLAADIPTLDHGSKLTGLLDDDHTQYILKSLFDAQTLLAAVSDNTPVALAVAAQRLVGRITGGNIAALTAAQVKTLLAIDHGADLAGLLDNDHTQYILKALLTTLGDVMVRGAAVPERLGVGSEGDVLTIVSGVPTWAAAGAGATVAFPSTEVFDGSGNCPNTWTDLDLSGVVGSNQALVFLRIYYDTNDAYATYFRKNGETINFDVSRGPNQCAPDPEEGGYIVIVTDASGIVEWKCGAAVTGITVTVEAYIKA